MTNPTAPIALPAEPLWLDQFVYLDGGTWVHIATSRRAAFEALAARQNLTCDEGRSVEELIEYLYGDSGLVSYNVCEVDSIDLD